MTQYTEEVLTAKAGADGNQLTDQLTLHQERIERLENNSDRLESYIINLSKYAANLNEQTDTNKEDIKHLIGEITELHKENIVLRIIIILLILLIYL